MQFEVFRREQVGSAKIFQRFFVVVSLKRDQAQQIIGVGGVRIGRQNLSIERHRLIQTAGLMVGDGGLQVCLGHCAAELHGAQVAGVALKQ